MSVKFERAVSVKAESVKFEKVVSVKSVAVPVTFRVLWIVQALRTAQALRTVQIGRAHV